MALIDKPLLRAARRLPLASIPPTQLALRRIAYNWERSAITPVLGVDVSGRVS